SLTAWRRPRAPPSPTPCPRGSSPPCARSLRAWPDDVARAPGADRLRGLLRSVAGLGGGRAPPQRPAGHRQCGEQREGQPRPHDRYPPAGGGRGLRHGGGDELVELLRQDRSEGGQRGGGGALVEPGDERGHLVVEDRKS